MNFFQKYLPFYKRNLKVAGPIVLAQLGAAIVQLVDSLMVAQLGTVELAAVSFASSVFMLGFVAATGILLGGTPIIGQLFAQQRDLEITKVFQNLLLLSVVVAVVIMAVMSGVAYCLPFMGQDPAVVELATPYFIVMIVSLFPFLVFGACRTFLEGLGNTSAAMITIIVSNVINIVLNYFLIYGKCGFPQMGVLGAALATLISRVVLPFMIFAFLRYKKEWWVYIEQFRKHYFSFNVLREIFSVGFPIATQIVLESICFSLSAIMVGWLGAVSLAANQIAMNMSNMVFMIVLGISSATTIRVSHQYGAGDYPAMRMAANASIHLCLLVNGVLGLAMIVFRAEIVDWFTQDPAVVELAKQLIIVTGIFQLSDGMQAVGVGILRGLKDVRICMYVAFMAYIVLNLPLGYVLAFVFDLGAVGVWVAIIFGLSCAAIMFRIRYMKQFVRIEQGLPMLK